MIFENIKTKMIALNMCFLSWFLWFYFIFENRKQSDKCDAKQALKALLSYSFESHFVESIGLIKEVSCL